MASQNINCGGPQHSSSTSSDLPIPTPRRQSSVRFAEGTKLMSQSPMSSYHRTPSDSDEATPIRTADGSSDRQYQSTRENVPQNTGTSSTSTPSDPVSSTLISTTPDGASNADTETNNGDSKKKGRISTWLNRMSERYGSITLENKGSVARDHLALERTFLAWLRTSLAFASIGIAVTQLFRLNTTIQNRNATARSLAQSMPLSPLIGQSVPAEMLPFLQQLAACMPPSPTPSMLGPTLLDQLLLLPAKGASPGGSESLWVSQEGQRISPRAIGDDSATSLRHVGKPLGATFIAISIVILFIGFHRYFEAQHWVIRGKFPAGRGSIFVVAFITGSLIVACLVVVLALTTNAPHG